MARPIRPRPEVAETSVLIPFLRSGAFASEIESARIRGRLQLPSIATLELYAGVRTQAEKRELDGFVLGFTRRGLVLTPTDQDHVLAGILLSRRRQQAGDLNVRDHIMDVLIVLSAAQVGGTVLTQNVRHMELWAGLARRAGKDVHVRAPSP